MPNRFSRALLGVLSLIVGLTFGCASARDLHFKTKTGTHAVVIGPKARDLTIEALHLSRNAQDVAFWVSRDRGKKLYIEFTEQPFENMRRQENGRFRVQCEGRHCYSDEISREAAYNHPYKYWQILDDGSAREEADGIIIIDP